MQESRLFQIVYYLLDKGQATAPELAKRFEVFWIRHYCPGRKNRRFLRPCRASILPEI